MDKQKIVEELDNFWYYYKVHVLVGVFVIAVILYIVLTGGQTKDAALNVVITGNAMDEEKQADVQKTATKDILGKNSDLIIKLDFWTANDGLSNGKHGDLQEKLMAMVAAKDIDVFILDQDAFRLYAKQSTFLKLHPLKGSLPDDTQYLKAKEKDDSQSHVYGIKIDGNQRLKKAGYDTKNKVLAIAGNTEHPKRSSQLVKWIIHSNKQE